MFLQLQDVHIQFSWDHPALEAQLNQVFQGWATAVSPHPPHIQFHLHWVANLPPLPQTDPLFTDSHTLPDNIGILTVYPHDGDAILLHFLDGALVELSLYRGKASYPLVVNAWITPTSVAYGRFEDIIYTSLAPLLRRHGGYMLHAFAATKDGQAAVIVGPSGSGKTTTGLSLLLAGWQLLTNDILLMQPQQGRIWALPTPGIVSIRDYTFELLPQLRPLARQAGSHTTKAEIPSAQLAGTHWAAPTPIQAIFFPHIEQRPSTTLCPMNKAICLVKLMEESIDRWDADFVPPHMALLQQLTQETAVYHLHLGQNMVTLPDLISQTMFPATHLVPGDSR